MNKNNRVENNPIEQKMSEIDLISDDEFKLILKELPDTILDTMNYLLNTDLKKLFFSIDKTNITKSIELLNAILPDITTKAKTRCCLKFNLKSAPFYNKRKLLIKPN